MVAYGHGVGSLLARGIAGSTLLVAGGYCYARLPRQTWLDRVPLLWSVRAAPHHLAWGLGLSAAGLLLLTWAWWELRRTAGVGSAGLTRVRRAALLWSAPLLCAPPLFSGDGWSYVATGALAGQGRSPYLWTPAALPVPLRSGVAPMWRLTPSPYGPLSLGWGATFARVTHDPWLLLAGYRLAAVLGLALLAWAVPLLAARVGHDPVDASALVVASPFVLAHGIGGLHNDLAMAALALTALAVTRPGRWLPGALLVGLAAAVKAPGLVAGLGVVLLSLDSGAGWIARVRRSALVGAVATGVLLVTGWVTGLGTGWITALSVPEHEYTVLSLSAVGGRLVRSVLRHAGPAGVGLIHEVHPELFAKRLGLATLVVIGAWTLFRTRLGPPRNAVAAAGAVLLLAVVLSPVVHYWYFLWCVPVLACLPLGRSGKAALVAGITILGLTAPADRALRITWLWEGGAWALVLVPTVTWAVTALRDRIRTGEASPDRYEARPM
jgi:alpha-1,6-mannosyltransferase